MEQRNLCNPRSPLFIPKDDKIRLENSVENQFSRVLSIPAQHKDRGTLANRTIFLLTGNELEE